MVCWDATDYYVHNKVFWQKVKLLISYQHFVLTEIVSLGSFCYYY